MNDSPGSETPNPTEVQNIVEQVRTEAAVNNAAMPLEVTLETGQVYRGHTPQELLDQFKKAQENASRTIKEQKDELARLQAEMAQRQTAQSPPNSQESYSPDEYFKLWQKDPLEAQKYVSRFDPETQQLKQVVNRFNQASAVEQFRANTGFQPKNQAEVETFNQVFMASRLQPTAENLELIYWRMVNQGQLSQPQISGINNPSPVPPNMNGQPVQASGFDWDAYYRMTPEQQEEVIRRMEKAGVR